MPFEQNCPWEADLAAPSANLATVDVIQVPDQKSAKKNRQPYKSGKKQNTMSSERRWLTGTNHGPHCLEDLIAILTMASSE